jgi:hypothetical protein
MSAITQDLFTTVKNEFGFLIGKYQTAYIKVNGEAVGKIKLRVSDHSMNGRNEDTDFTLSIVIGDNPTNNKFIVSDNVEQMYYSELNEETVSYVCQDIRDYVYGQFAEILADGEKFEIVWA